MLWGLFYFQESSSYLDILNYSLFFCFVEIYFNMEEFRIDSFAAEPTLQVLNTLTKHQLTEVANFYKLAVTGSMKKGEVKRLLVDYLIDKELVPEDEERLPVTVDSNTLELKCLDLQEQESAREVQLKLKELEIKEKEILFRLRMKELETSSLPRARSPAVTLEARSPEFGVSKHIKLVPPLQEREVDKYFLRFEKISTSLEWPKTVWMLLLQSVLMVKAREVYSSMLTEQSSQYKTVKKAILRAYELVPEAYRQNFRSYRKTYTEFAREKEVLFDRWCLSKEIAQDFCKLRQLILIEDVYQQVSKHT